jgi:TM2 domain-containing membrane protein YozV
MNGQQDPRQGYPENAGAPYGAPPPPASGSGQQDPGLGHVPSTWRKNIYGYGDDPRRKSPALAAILSGMPGLGQIYVGYYNQGFVNMIVCGTTIFLLNATGHHYGSVVGGLQGFLGFFLAFYWLYNMMDAYRRAIFYNQALAGLGAVEIPEDMKLPKAGGSMAGGVALIVIGGLLFANTALGMSLDWLEQWWPMGLVLLGAYLVYASAAAKRTAAAPRARMEDPAERA